MKKSAYFYSREKASLSFFAITLLAISTLPFSSDAFANHLSENLKWQLVFVSGESGCSNYHYQMMNKYDQLSESYLNEYKIENEPYDPECIPEKNYPRNYERPLDLDLFVLVYDKNLGEEILQSNNVGGIYRHFGSDRNTNHVVVFCDCPNFDYSDPAWILTHELSHFALFYLGYDSSIIEDLVHSNDKSFDECREEWNKDCFNTIQKVPIGENGYLQTVMPIYRPAAENSTIISEEEISPNSLELSKLITKWWASGQKIETEEYNQAIHLLGLGKESNQINGKIEFYDEPIDEKTTWKELLYGKSEFDSSIIFSHIPFEVLEEEPVEISNNSESLPEWFRETTFWWSNGEITDMDYAYATNYLEEKGLLNPSFNFRNFMR